MKTFGEGGRAGARAGGGNCGRGQRVGVVGRCRWLSGMHRIPHLIGGAGRAGWWAFGEGSPPNFHES
eukprot:scaffold88717_cov14-Tisochrysis_lutea.AAC.1